MHKQAKTGGAPGREPGVVLFGSFGEGRRPAGRRGECEGADGDGEARMTLERAQEWNHGDSWGFGRVLGPPAFLEQRFIRLRVQPAVAVTPSVDAPNPMKHPLSRRDFLKTSALAAGAGLTSPLWQSGLRADPNPPGRIIMPGPFRPTWESLVRNYTFPDWFRDAKFGMWAHWTAQCVPEQGDWYARRMYLQGGRTTTTTSGPTATRRSSGSWRSTTSGRPTMGAREADRALQAGRGEVLRRPRQPPRQFRYVRLEVPAWNSVNVGPKKDIVGTWAKMARANGLRFGVSNHSSRASRWLQPAYGYDGEGPLAGVRYDASTLTKADGRANGGRGWIRRTSIAGCRS